MELKKPVVERRHDGAHDQERQVEDSEDCCRYAGEHYIPSFLHEREDIELHTAAGMA